MSQSSYFGEFSPMIDTVTQEKTRKCDRCVEKQTNNDMERIVPFLSKNSTMIDPHQTIEVNSGSHVTTSS
jgi:hypothetical protein